MTEARQHLGRLVCAAAEGTPQLVLRYRSAPDHPPRRPGPVTEPALAAVGEGAAEAGKPPGPPHDTAHASRDTTDTAVPVSAPAVRRRVAGFATAVAEAATARRRAVSFGPTALDEALGGGVSPGRLVVVVGAPGAGAGLLAAGAVLSATLAPADDPDKPNAVLLYTSGRPRADIAARLIAAAAGVDHRRLRAGTLTDTERATADAASAGLAAGGLFLDEGDDLTLACSGRPPPTSRACARSPWIRSTTFSRAPSAPMYGRPWPCCAAWPGTWTCRWWRCGRPARVKGPKSWRRWPTRTRGASEGELALRSSRKRDSARSPEPRCTPTSPTSTSPKPPPPAHPRPHRQQPPRPQQPPPLPIPEPARRRPRPPRPPNPPPPHGDPRAHPRPTAGTGVEGAPGRRRHRRGPLPGAIAGTVQDELAAAEGDVGAAAQALSKRAIPDVMKLFDPPGPAPATNTPATRPCPTCSASHIGPHARPGTGSVPA
ncbi:DnaB-like helicase C-terminal domain-containing protein [Embleya sp. NPDC001921]